MSTPSISLQGLSLPPVAAQLLRSAMQSGCTLPLLRCTGPTRALFIFSTSAAARSWALWASEPESISEYICHAVALHGRCVVVSLVGLWWS
jgi:hypothetical protein